MILIMLMVALICVASCADKQTISFSSDEPLSKLAIVNLDSIESEAETLTNGAKIRVSKLSGKAVKISSTGKSSFFWLLPKTKNGNTQIRIKKLPSCETHEENRNRPIRFLLKAYQALYSNDFNTAIKMSETASSFDPLLAAPHIISGLSYLKQKKIPEAKTAFLKAQALDPEDKEIEVLLKMVQ